MPKQHMAASAFSVDPDKWNPGSWRNRWVDQIRMMLIEEKDAALADG
jgi:hypothetical protein